MLLPNFYLLHPQLSPRQVYFLCCTSLKKKKKNGIGARMEKQIGDFTVSIDALAAPLPLFSGIHSGQSVRSHFPKGDITLSTAGHLAPSPHFQCVLGRGALGWGVHPKAAAEADKESSDVSQCPPYSSPHICAPCDKVISQGGECQNHSSAPTQTPGGSWGQGVGVGRLVIGRRLSS